MCTLKQALEITGFIEITAVADSTVTCASCASLIERNSKVFINPKSPDLTEFYCSPCLMAIPDKWSEEADRTYRDGNYYD